MSQDVLVQVQSRAPRPNEGKVSRVIMRPIVGANFVLSKSPCYSSRDMFRGGARGGFIANSAVSIAFCRRKTLRRYRVATSERRRSPGRYPATFRLRNRFSAPEYHVSNQLDRTARADEVRYRRACNRLRSAEARRESSNESTHAGCQPEFLSLDTDAHAGG